MSWIIYKHTNKINGKIYIGQTRQKTKYRWQNGNGYLHNKYFYNAIKKYKWKNFDHEIIQKNINTLEEANNAEIYWISFYNSYVGFEKSNGYNLTKGGENHDHLGKAIAQIDTSTKDIVNVFITIRKAENDTGIDHSLISSCCKKNKKNITAGGFYWCYLDEYHKNNWTPKKKKNYHDKKDKQILQLNDDFEIVNTFYSQLDAKKHTGISASNISNACNKKRGYSKPGGFYWCFKKDYGTFSPLMPKDEKPVIRIDKHDFSKTKEYRMISEAARDSNIKNSECISRVCKGKQLLAGNYYWCYKSDYSKNWTPRINKNLIEVICVETKERFNSISEAAKKLNLSDTLIGRCCKDSGYTCGGFHWCYLKDFDNFEIRNKKTTAIKIVCIETGLIFNSNKEASLKLNICASSISHSCKNPAKTAGGYHWAYYERT